MRFPAGQARGKLAFLRRLPHLAATVGQSRYPKGKQILTDPCNGEKEKRCFSRASVLYKLMDDWGRSFPPGGALWSQQDQREGGGKHIIPYSLNPPVNLLLISQTPPDSPPAPDQGLLHGLHGPLKGLVLSSYSSELVQYFPSWGWEEPKLCFVTQDPLILVTSYSSSFLSHSSRASPAIPDDSAPDSILSIFLHVSCIFTLLTTCQG